MEVTHETPARKVFKLKTEAGQPAGGWHVYRAHRIPGFYGSAPGIRD